MGNKVLSVEGPTTFCWEGIRGTTGVGSVEGGEGNKEAIFCGTECVCWTESLELLDFVGVWLGV